MEMTLADHAEAGGGNKENSPAPWIPNNGGKCTRRGSSGHLPICTAHDTDHW